MRLEKFIFWAFTAIVVLGFGALSFAMAPYMDDAFEDDSVWVFVIVGLVVLFIALNALIAVFIYKDASKRNMNAWLWMLAVIYIPNFIGLLIYLFARRQHHSLSETEPRNKPIQCPHCGKLIHS
ncbi:PLDc N-terminal domain-containing protein [Paenibacillus tianjinensis]|uniref:PLDc N-terminal domain-containing protein n=1 Tax=Paenibacillus tianjinensis TaxID=2810347 RepID=A0ABX7LCE2_9BACL|nr:PLDc N-terminal domain-containing protein [Paenibacillus tianjinensis]QSF45041.1 PLDc N-terminal domain-containing protein [Paenibacillus tianjinensis]